MSPTPDLERFIANVEAGGVCWEWRGVRERNGYAKFKLNGKSEWVHRASWGLLVGPIPPGLTIDHLCRNKVCVNPDHMEVVTRAENIRRAARRHTCVRGHRRTARNTYVTPDGKRRCRDCARERDRARKTAVVCPHCGLVRTNLRRHIRIQHQRETQNA